MMNQLTLSLNIFLLALILVIAGFAGFVFGRRKIMQKEDRIVELEREMLRSHAEILNLTRQNTALKEHEAGDQKNAADTAEHEIDPKIRKIG